MRIAVAVTNDLIADQRVGRTCSTLFENGYSVILIGRQLDDRQPLLRPYPCRRMRLLFRRGFLFYAEYNIRLFLRLLFLRFDMAYANDTDALPACLLAAKLRRKKVFFDAHELFPEVPELCGRRRVKQFWQRIEDICIPRVDAMITVCQSIADIYSRRYGISVGVVRNLPVMESHLPTTPLSPPAILYQGAVNIGRGIDHIIDAMQFLPDCQFLIAGIGDQYEMMQAYARSKPWHDRIHFLGRLSPKELHELTPQATLGVCLLEPRGLNYYFAFPNRIGDFIAAGVPLLATDLPEISRVVQTYGVGYTIGYQKGEELAMLIANAMKDWNALPDKEKQTRFEKARHDLDWNKEKMVLLNAVHSVFSAQ
ncbi:MAG: glycosyltransferase [Bacteroidales bacterium]|nr:glycosyltransferase [Bacteroidales bacterium]